MQKVFMSPSAIAEICGTDRETVKIVFQELFARIVFIYIHQYLCD